MERTLGVVVSDGVPVLQIGLTASPEYQRQCVADMGSDAMSLFLEHCGQDLCNAKTARASGQDAKKAINDAVETFRHHMRTGQVPIFVIAQMSDVFCQPGFFPYRGPASTSTLYGSDAVELDFHFAVGVLAAGYLFD